MDQREQARLKKEPFKTMVTDLLPTTVDALRGWREPPGAYVLFEARKKRLGSDYSHYDHSSLFTLWVEHRPSQESKIQHYVRKGYKPIHYGKFPDFNDPDPIRRQMAITHAGKDRRNPWKHLEAVVLEAMRNASGVTALAVVEAEKKAIEAKAKEMQEQNRTLERRVLELEAKRKEAQKNGA